VRNWVAALIEFGAIFVNAEISRFTLEPGSRLTVRTIASRVSRLVTRPGPPG